MSHENESQPATDLYILRQVQEGVDTSSRYEASISARIFYENARHSRTRHSERTIEMRRLELLDLFGCIDKEKEFSNDQTRVVLREVPNVLKTVTFHKQPEAVMRTEIVPMLPCKGYGLPQKTLFIGGRGDYVTVSRPMEGDQLEELLENIRPMEEDHFREFSEKIRPMEEQLLVEYLAEQQSGEQSEELVKEPAEKGATPKIQSTRKAKKIGKESEVKQGVGIGLALPNCAMG